MASKGLTLNQKAAILYIANTRGGVAVKVRQVVAEALVRRGYAEWVNIPLTSKRGLRLTAAGRQYAKNGEQIA